MTSSSSHNSSPPSLNTVVIIGVGLIGGSLALALRRSGQVAKVVGVDRDEQALQEALRLGIIDRFETSAAKAAEGAQLIVVATPVLTLNKVFESLREGLTKETVVTDVASVKEPVVSGFRQVFGEIWPGLVPGHPIAGSERSGVGAADAGLFVDHRVILTPLAQTSPAALALVRTMWRLAGAEPVEMGVGHHDEVLAATSHLPHVLAYSLVNTLARQEQGLEIFRYAAGGFRDFTRIASSDPQMWHDICLANRAPLLKMIDLFSADLAQLRAAIESGDSEGVYGVFNNAKTARDHFIRLAQSARTGINREDE